MLQKMKKPLYQKNGTGMEKEIIRTDIEMDKLKRMVSQQKILDGIISQ